MTDKPKPSDPKIDLYEILLSAPDPGVTLKVLKSLASEKGDKTFLREEQIRSFALAIGGPIEDRTLSEAFTYLIEGGIITELGESGIYALKSPDLALEITLRTDRFEHGLGKVKAFIDYTYAEHLKRSFLLSENDLRHIKLFERGLYLEEEKKIFLEKSRKAVRRKNVKRKIEVVATSAVIVSLVFLSILIYNEKDRSSDAMNEARLSAQASVSDQEALAEQSRKALERAAVAEKQLEEAFSRENEAKQQAKLANQNYRNAVNQARMAREQKEETDRQRILAEEKQMAAEVQSEQAEKALVASTRHKMVSIAISLANKSILQRTQPLKNQLALEAYHLYNQNSEYPFESSVYNAFYYARKNVAGDYFNELTGHDGTRINQIDIINEEHYTLGDDGKLMIWERTAAGFSRREIDLRFIYYWEEGEMDIIASSIDSHNIQSLAANDQNTYLVSTGSKRFLQINQSTDEVYEIIVDDFEGQLIKIFPAVTGWHVISTSQFTHITATSPDQITSNTYPLERKALSAIRSENGYYLLGTDEVYDLDISTIQQTSVGLKIGSFPTNLSVAPDFAFMAVGYASGEVSLYDLNTKGQIEQLTGHTARISSLQFSEDMKRLVSGGYDRTLNIWDLEDFTREPIQFSDHDSFITALHYDQTNDLIMVGEVDGTLKYYNLDCDESIEQLCATVINPLSEKEWIRYVGENITYDPYSCSSSPF